MMVCKEVKKKYGSLEVLKGIDLTIDKGEFISIVGSSGAGKSTLLYMLGALDTPDSGSIIWKEQPLSNFRQNELNSLRNLSFGFIFQFHHLLPEFTALENVMIPGWIAGKADKEILPYAEELFSILNLTERMSHKPNQMSGGEQQRVAIARALINKPEILFADEPTGNLDSENAAQIHQLFLDIWNVLGISLVVVTHQHDLAALAPRRLSMKDGLIIS